MTKLFFCTVLLFGLQTVRAEDVPAPAPETTAAAQDIQQPKSFFEMRTFSEVQQEVKADTTFSDGSADMSSIVGG
jgi:hypothetical protein